MTDEKIKKKKSLSTQINELRKKNSTINKLYWNIWSDLRDLEIEFDKIQKIFPKKYFKIFFKIKSNSEYMVNKEEIVEAFSANLAIEKIKKNKTHPDSFELVDIKILA